MKKILSLILSSILTLSLIVTPVKSYAAGEVNATVADPVNVLSAHVLLMEASTGTILFEKNSHEQVHPASITKIMTLLLIFQALEEGKINLTDTVSVSEYAASMGGSQVFLEPFEKQTVETMIKCIAVASANDACVAMAEHIAGSETEFVNKMNQMASSLGMKDTTFVNCCGLDADGHMTTAYDVALMSRELLVKYPQIQNYSTIWMENITHTTAKGSQEFGLTNTNKLIRQYEYATGLKTGSTSKAKYCVSASAKKGNISLIAVVMGGENSKQRFSDAMAMLNYGFATCQVYTDNDKSRENPGFITVKKGKETRVPIVYEKDFSYVTTTGENITNIKKELVKEEFLVAPFSKGTKVGELIYRNDNKEIGSVNLVTLTGAYKSGYGDYYIRAWNAWML